MTTVAAKPALAPPAAGSGRRAILFAAVTAILGVVLLFVYHHRYEQEVSGGARMRVLSVQKLVPRGTVMTEEMLSVHEVPQSCFEDRMIRESERPKIVGLRIANTVRAQESLTWSDVAAASDERRDLSSLIQPGSRAVAIRANRDEAHLGLIRPGDYVDVIGTMQGPTHDTRSAALLLQRVLVLATATSAEARESGQALLTLSLTVPEAQVLAIASERGRLTVALRNPEDPKTSDRIPDLVSTTVVNDKERAHIKGVRGPQKLEAGND
jgi:pilus assembly protein CpaB